MNLENDVVSNNQEIQPNIIHEESGLRKENLLDSLSNFIKSIKAKNYKHIQPIKLNLEGKIDFSRKRTIQCGKYNSQDIVVKWSYYNKNIEPLIALEINNLIAFQSHPNRIVKLIGITSSITTRINPQSNLEEEVIEIGIILEKALYGSLDQYLSQYPTTSFDRRLDWCIQLCNIIQLFHDKNFLHRDIKPHNILLFDEDQIKLCDFEISKKIEDEMQTITYVGTPHYSAPETYRKVNDDKLKGHYTLHSEIYSLGLTLAFILTNLIVPIDKSKSSFISNSIDYATKNQILPFSHISEIKKLLLSCIDDIPSKRITIDNLLRELSNIRNSFQISLPVNPSISEQPLQSIPEYHFEELIRKHQLNPQISLSIQQMYDWMVDLLLPKIAFQYCDILLENSITSLEELSELILNQSISLEEINITNKIHIHKIERALQTLHLSNKIEETIGETLSNNSNEPSDSPMTPEENEIIAIITIDFNEAETLLEDLKKGNISNLEKLQSMNIFESKVCLFEYFCEVYNKKEMERYGKALFDPAYGLFEDETIEEEYKSKIINLVINCLKEGWGTERNVNKGYEIAKEYAEKGFPVAQNNLGLCYYYGQGVAKDYLQAIEWYRKAADQGYPNSQNNLGVCYYNGQGVSKDYEKAVEWYRKAADQGFADAQNNLGICYFKGEGVEQDYSKAVEWYRKAANQGHVFAQSRLGICYYHGKGVDQNYSIAVNWYRKAAKQGYANAQSNLGICYYNGKGVHQDYVLAAEWYRQAADQGHVFAQSRLGVCYDKGEGVVQDYFKAAEWFFKAADQGYANAQYNLGICYYNGKGVDQDYVIAVEWYFEAVKQGYADAQNNLGICYYNGKGVKQDYVKAIEWYRKATGQGFADAQNNLGVCYYYGQGVTKDYTLALEWYCKAADQGYPNSQNNIGICYYNGQGVSKDYVKAVEWYRKAADQGFADAQNNLGVCYFNGQGVSKDYTLSAKWYRKAADQGYDDAQYNLRALEVKSANSNNTISSRIIFYK